jgi:long-subunit acyl-CoA synthetase (AMP-forming)
MTCTCISFRRNRDSRRGRNVSLDRRRLAMPLANPQGSEDLIAGSAPNEDARRGADQLAAIPHTGGATGFPKGVMQPCQPGDCGLRCG